MSLSMNHASSDEGTQLSEATRNRVTLAPMSQDDLDAVIALLTQIFVSLGTL